MIVVITTEVYIILFVVNYRLNVYMISVVRLFWVTYRVIVLVLPLR